MPTFDLNGKRVLVIGGSGRLGSLIGAELQQRGATVLATGRYDSRLEPPESNALAFDLRSDDPGTLIGQTLGRLGGLDGIVNAAGVVAFGPLEELSDRALDELVTTNFVAPLRVLREAVPHLEGGFWVSITGVVAEQPVGGMAAYSAVKAGLSAATRALTRELRRKKIHVLDARPPHTETGLATRPIEGNPPALPTGLNPDDVARRIVDGLVAGERELSSTQFA
jgi:cyclic-di-GMP-binding biofilm dispersal mediator protein